jgi:tRNA nucleotidyltransferase/poly(A) polymerase
LAPAGAATPATVADVDLIVRHDPGEAARALGRAGGAASFALSERHGGWRVVARDGSWQIDVEQMRGDSLEDDLRLRDFTVNAVAQTLDGAHTVDPLGGLRDLADRRLRAASGGAFAEDPLRVLRLVRLAAVMGLSADDDTVAAARACAARLSSVSGERVFDELKLIVGSADPVGALDMADAVGATAVVLPELYALHGVGQSRFHHLDVYGHTMQALAETVALTGRYGSALPATGEVAQAPGPLDDWLDSAQRGALAEVLDTPVADGLTRAAALRWGILLHDAAKPATRTVDALGRVSFAGHDAQGAQLAESLLGRMRASTRLRGHVAGLVREHLRLGFLVHERQPLDRRLVYRYLRACEPVAVDVTLLSVCDRLSTRGKRSEEAIAAHLQLAGVMLADALSWQAHGPPPRLWRGDELADALGIEPGPQLGSILEAVGEAQYAGAVTTRDQALQHARGVLASNGAPA